MSVRNTAQSSMTRCQSLFRRDSRETSVTMTMPTSPRPIAATKRWKPRRRWLLAPDKPRSSSITRTAVSGQPICRARHARSYWRRVLSWLFWICCGVDWRM